MFYKINSNKLQLFSDLIRLNKPIGVFLLVWPCWFGLAYIHNYELELIRWYLYFIIGAFLMRSAGCIINDIVDINLDKTVKRTASRPLASNNISLTEIISLLILILLVSLYILLQFNIYSIFLGLFSLPLIFLYPFLKRYTYWPQLGLGLVFNWGVLIVSVEFSFIISYDLLILYIGCVFWTLGYDTIYAYQDIEDDVKNNIKSTAVLFGEKGKKFVMFFYGIFFTIIGLLGFYSSKSYLSLIVIFVIIVVIGYCLNKWKLNSVTSSNYYFKFNNIIGLVSFLYLLIF
mgnify:CR=1 FL=1